MQIHEIKNFDYVWTNCIKLTNFPLINTYKGKSFKGSWAGCKNLQSFPKLNLSNGRSFNFCWSRCENLQHFPPNMFDNLIGTMKQFCFINAWKKCDLSIISVENILTSIDRADICPYNYNETIDVHTKYNKILTLKTLNAIRSLENKHWTVKLKNI